MTKEDIKYQAYIQILKEELIPAMGCTEPIALAYAAAKAREVLGCIPERVHIGASGSIIKNVKSVIVPNTNHLKGIPAAATAGIIAGDASKELEVISDVTEAQTKEMAKYLEETEITVEHIDNGCIFDIIVEVFAGKDSAKVRIANYHTNIVRIEKNGKIIMNIPITVGVVGVVFAPILTLIGLSASVLAKYRIKIENEDEGTIVDLGEFSEEKLNIIKDMVSSATKDVKQAVDKRNKKTEDKNEVDDDDVIIDLNKNDYREKRDEE